MHELSQQKLKQLKAVLSPYTAVTVMPHRDPDPDAIASTVALAYLFTSWGKSVATYYGGRIGRAENKSLMNFLQRPIAPLLRIPEGPIILVDTQPASGNNVLSTEIPILAVIDHHPLHASSQALAFSDIRPEIGSTATILTEYLQCADLVPDATMATALFYGIKSDTLDLERQTTPNDIACYDYLRPLINKRALAQIEKAQVSAEYFHHAFDALKNAQIYDHLLVSYLGEMSYPDLPAEMADWLMRYDGIGWVLVMGLYKDKMHLSVRAHPPKGSANDLMRAIVNGIGTGGGHETMAGGQIPLNDTKTLQLIRRIRKNAQRYLKIPEKTPGRGLLTL